MNRINKDLGSRLTEVLCAWEKMRPQKQFFGLTLDDLKARSKAFVDARDEILDLEARTTHAVSKRDAAAIGLAAIVQGVVDAVKGDPSEGPNGELYSAMGYVPRSKRASGLVRRNKLLPPVTPAVES